MNNSGSNPSVTTTMSNSLIPRTWGGPGIFRRPAAWMVLAAAFAIADMILPAYLHVSGMALAVVPLAWVTLHRRSIPLCLAAFMAAVAIPGLWQVLVESLGWSSGSETYAQATLREMAIELPAGLVPFWMFGAERLWTIAALTALWWLHNHMQYRRRRRLIFRRELLERVRERTGQVKRANLALRREVARRQETQHLLDQSENTFQALIERMELQVTRKDQHGVITAANDTFCSKLGLTPTQVIGSTDADLFEHDIAQKYRDDDLQVMQSGQTVDQIERHPTADGRTGFAQVFKAPEYDKDGNCVGVQIIFWDITQKHLGDIALRDSEARKRALFEAAGDAVLLLDAQNRVVEANPAAGELFGTDLQGKFFQEIASPTESNFAPGSRDPNKTRDWGSMQKGVRHEITIRRADDSTFVSELSMHDIPVGPDQGCAVIVRDVTLRNRAFEALRSAKAAAEMANRTKTEFMASVSHELRTPLGGIMGLADLLGKMELSTQSRQYVGMIRENATSLSEVIEDILDFAAIEAGRVEIDPQPIDLHRVIGDAFKSLAVRASDRPLRLVFSVAPGVPRYVVGDAKRLRQIVVNLAGNAIKFTHQGEVRVRLDTHQEALDPDSDRVSVVLEVADTGVGIAFEKQASVFAAFERGEVGTKRSFGGTGLGLSISDGLVRRMDGKIGLTSQPGVGSRFTCTIPFDVADGPSDVTDGVNDTIGSPPKSSTSESTTDVTLRMTDPVDAVVLTGSRMMNLAVEETLQQQGIEILSEDKLAERTSNQRLVWFLHVDIDHEWQKSFQAATDRAIWIQPVGHEPSPLSSSRDLFVNEPVTPTDVLELLQRVQSDHDQYGSSENQGLIKPADSETKSESKSNSGKSEPATQRNSQQSVGKLLLVDDSEVNRVVITQQLLSLGYEVETAVDGEQAVSMATRGEYDAILMDLQMPKMDGAEATVHIRESYRRQSKPGPPIIALTAHVTHEHQQLCRDAGMVGFVTKPIRLEDLQQTLESELAQHDEDPPTELANASADDKDHSQDAIIRDEQAESNGLSEAKERLLRHAGGNAQVAGSLCDAFVQEVPDLLRRLRKHQGDDPFPELIRAAHTLKSCLKYVADADDITLAVELESLAKANEFPTEDQMERMDQVAQSWVDRVQILRNEWSD